MIFKKTWKSLRLIIIIMKSLPDLCAQPQLPRARQEGPAWGRSCCCGTRSTTQTWWPRGWLGILTYYVGNFLLQSFKRPLWSKEVLRFMRGGSFLSKNDKEAKKRMATCRWCFVRVRPPRAVWGLQEPSPRRTGSPPAWSSSAWISPRTPPAPEGPCLRRTSPWGARGGDGGGGGGVWGVCGGSSCHRGCCTWTWRDGCGVGRTHSPPSRWEAPECQSNFENTDKLI